MPIKIYDQKGTEADGHLSEKYCKYCYKDGCFTWPEATPEEMQTYCMGILTCHKHFPTFLARAATKSIPKLERWQKS